jgi:hypothetical protein
MTSTFVFVAKEVPSLIMHILLVQLAFIELELIGVPPKLAVIFSGPSLTAISHWEKSSWKYEVV